MEEPASVIFSVLNLLASVFAWNKYRRSCKTDPYFFHWTFQTLLTVNAWFWSALFHIRQSPVTEVTTFAEEPSLRIWCLSEIRLLLCLFFSHLFTVHYNRPIIGLSPNKFNKIANTYRDRNAVPGLLYLSHTLPLLHSL